MSWDRMIEIWPYQALYANFRYRNSYKKCRLKELHDCITMIGHNAQKSIFHYKVRDFVCLSRLQMTRNVERTLPYLNKPTKREKNGKQKFPKPSASIYSISVFFFRPRFFTSVSELSLAQTVYLPKERLSIIHKLCFSFTYSLLIL